MSGIPFYHDLLRDHRRVEAFRTLIQEAVGPGQKVVEVGAGLGTYSIFAAQAGAKQVWAIESDPVAHVAEQIVQINGFHDRVSVIRGTAPEVELPERADVLIFEDHSTRLFDEQSVNALAACVDAYLRPGGRVLPGWARMCVAPVRSEDAWRASFPFGPAAFEEYGIDWAPTAGYAENHPRLVDLPADSLTASPTVLAETLIHPAPGVRRLGGSWDWLPEAGPVHGIAYWFELWMGSAGWLSNAPGAGGAWGQLFLPFRTPLEVGTGVALRATVQVQETPGGRPGWLTWSARAGEAVRTGHEFAGMPASLEDLYPNHESVRAVEPRRRDPSTNPEAGPPSPPAAP